MKKIISILLFIVMLAMYIPAYSAGELTLNTPELVQITDSMTKLISQSIKIDLANCNEYKNKVITIAIIEENKDKTDVKELVDFYQEILPDTATFSKTIPFVGAGGKYLVRVAVSDFNKVLEKYIDIPDVQMINTFVSSFVKGDYTKETLREKILTDGNKLNIDINIFSKLSENVQLQICDAVLTGGKDLFFEDIKRKIDKNTALYSVKDPVDSIVLESIEYYNDAYFTLANEDAYKLFKAADDDFKSDVLTNLRENTYTDFSVYKEDFIKAVDFFDFIKVTLSTQLKAKIDAYNHYLASDVYNTYKGFIESNKNNVAGYLYANLGLCKSMADIAQRFDYVINNYKVLYPPVIVGNGGGGGSSPTGSSGNKQEVAMSQGMNTEEKPIEIDNVSITTSLNDLDSVEWAKEAINYLFNNKIVSGRGNNMYYPDAPVTRAEFVKMLVGAIDLKDAGKSVEFSDVDKTHWAYSYISLGNSNGLISGIGASQFGTDLNITRQDVCTIMYRVVSLKGKMEIVEEIDADFTDMSSVSYYAQNAVKMLSTYKLVNGYPDGSFKPEAAVTRAEAAQLVYSLINYIEGGSL